jgi:trehalose 6-phosphate synthase
MPGPSQVGGTDPLAGPGADPGAAHLGGISTAERATFA